MMIRWWEHSERERLKRRNTLGCLDHMLDPQSHHNPQPKRSSSSGTLNMIPPWNIHTVKQSMPRSWLFFELVHSLRVLSIGKTPVRIILWCPTTIMVIKACFLIQPLEQEGGCQKCCISLCSKVFINHFYQMKASPECLNILIYWNKCWVERLRRTLRRKVKTGILYQQIYRLCHYILHKVAHIDCSVPSGNSMNHKLGSG